jgi:hypothetical protein
VRCDAPNPNWSKQREEMVRMIGTEDVEALERGDELGDGVLDLDSGVGYEIGCAIDNESVGLDADQLDRVTTAVFNTLRSLPVEQRMEAMGMVPAAWIIPPIEGWSADCVIERDETPIPERLDRRGSGEDGWPNEAWHLLWCEPAALSCSDQSRSPAPAESGSVGPLAVDQSEVTE